MATDGVDSILAGESVLGVSGAAAVLGSSFFSALGSSFLATAGVGSFFSVVGGDDFFLVVEAVFLAPLLEGFPLVVMITLGFGVGAGGGGGVGAGGASSFFFTSPVIRLRNPFFSASPSAVNPMLAENNRIIPIPMGRTATGVMIEDRAFMRQFLGLCDESEQRG